MQASWGDKGRENTYKREGGCNKEGMKKIEEKSWRRTRKRK